MGRKVSPTSFRLKYNEMWRSRWFSDKDYAEKLIEDIKLRAKVLDLLKNAAVSKVEIERDSAQIVINVYSARPGVIIGRKGVGTTELKVKLQKLAKSRITLNIVEVKNPEADAALVGQNMAYQIENRIAFRRVMKQAVEKAMQAGAKGIKVLISGRLGGAEIARSEKLIAGLVPLSVIKSKIDYHLAEAKTTYGIIGIKVWIYKGQEERE
jgi:small subunit ribosomal protein S3